MIFEIYLGHLFLYCIIALALGFYAGFYAVYNVKGNMDFFLFFKKVLKLDKLFNLIWIPFIAIIKIITRIEIESPLKK